MEGKEVLPSHLQEALWPQLLVLMAYGGLGNAGRGASGKDWTS